ncbi:MAG: hypothetical protein Q9174_002071 [Haloplaca sp. 1 TL-2023]
MSHDKADEERAQVARLAETTPEIDEVIKPLGRNDLCDATDHLKARQDGEEAELAVLKALGPLDPSLHESELSIPMRDGYHNKARVTRPSSSEVEGPLVICFHGGGFMSGTIYNVAPYARGIAKLFNAVVVAPTYRLAPEHPFPQGINDAWDAVQWVAANASRLCNDLPRGFILSGGSAGANFVCVLAEMAKTEKLEPAFTGIWNCMPVVFTEDKESRSTIPQKYKHLWFSHEQVVSTPIINNDTAKKLFQYYDPDFKSPLWSPFNANSPFQGLPPTFVQVCGKDIIRDDGLIYEKMLSDNGVKTRLNVYPGLPHCFWAFIPQYKGSKEFMIDVAFGFAWLLGKQVDPAEAAKAMVFPVPT